MTTKRITLLEMKLQYARMLKEVGDLESIQSYPYSDNHFTTEEGWKIDVNFEDLDSEDFDLMDLQTDPKKSFNVGYAINGVDSQYAKTTYKKLIRILKTVSDMIVDFVKKNRETEALVFIASNKDPDKALTDTDPQKSALYKTVIVKNISKLGGRWKIKELEVDGFGYIGFALIKDKQNKK
jgi:hypothetical protein